MRAFWKIYGLVQALIGAGYSALAIVNWVTSNKVPEPPNVAELVYGHIFVLFFPLFLAGSGIYIFRHSK